MKKKVLITGSNGLLGQKLVKLIAEDNAYELIATSRGSNRLFFKGKNFLYVPMDITDKEQVKQVISQHKPEYIIHTAAMTNVDQCETEKEACWDQNVNAVKYLTEAVSGSNAFLIHLSTDFIFDGKEGPYPEEAAANPLSYYGESKLAAEEIVRKSNIDWAIARTVLVYGTAQDMSRSNIILWVKKSLEEGKNIQVVDDQLRSPTLAEDLAMGCYLIMQKRAKGIFNISGKDLLTPYQMAIKTAEFFKLDKSLITKTDSTKFKQPAQRPMRTGFILDKARKELGYAPRSFEEGIKIVADQVSEKISE